MNENRQEVRTRLKTLESIREQAINHSAKLLLEVVDQLEKIVLQYDDSDVDLIENILKMLELPVEVLQELKVLLEDTLKLQEKLRQKYLEKDSEN